MTDVPIYTSRLEIAGDTGVALQPMPLPPSGGGERIGEAIAGFGQAAGGLYEAMQKAQQHTKAAAATAEYLTQLDGLEQQATKDVITDYQNAPKRFYDAQRELQMTLAEDITDPALRAQTMLGWQRATLTAGTRIRHLAISHEQDVYLASLTAQEAEALKAAHEAPTPVQRQDAVDGYFRAVEDAERVGWITKQQGTARGLQFARSLAIADVMASQRRDPIATQKLLADPNSFPGLDPTTRENLRNNASNAADQLRAYQFAELAHTNPAGAREKLESERAEMEPHTYYRIAAAIDTQERQAAATIDHATKEAARAERSSDDVLNLVKQGYDVDRVRIENVRNANLAAAQRGDRDAAQYVQQLDLQMALQPHVRRAWSLPIVQLDGEIKRMEAAMAAPGANVTADQVTGYKAFRAVRDEIIAKRDVELIVLGGENGARHYQFNPLDASAAPGVMAAELMQRNGQAAVAQQLWGGKANALTAEETRALKDRWQQARPHERFAIIQTLGSSLTGRAYDDTVAAVVGDDPVMRFVGQVARSRPALARDILQGVQVLTDPKTKENSSAIRQELRQKINGSIYPTPDMQEVAISAAIALHAARRASSGSLYDPNDASGIGAAIEDITGPIVKLNGVRVPVTPGVRPDDFAAAIEKISEDGLRFIGGPSTYDTSVPSPPGGWLTPSAIDHFRAHATLRPLDVGGRRYAVVQQDSRMRDGFAPILSSDGRPLVIDMPALVSKRLLSLTNYQQGRGQFRLGQAQRLRAARLEGMGNAPATTLPATPEGAGLAEQPITEMEPSPPMPTYPGHPGVIAHLHVQPRA